MIKSVEWSFNHVKFCPFLISASSSSAHLQVNVQTILTLLSNNIFLLLFSLLQFESCFNLFWIGCWCLCQTYTGSILIAVNPFTRLPHLYNVHMMEQYKGAPFGELSPHVFAVADASYRFLRSCVIFVVNLWILNGR